MTTLVMIHGSGSCRENWHYQLEAFPGSHAVNLPGHPDGECLTTIEACAEWVHGYVAEHGVKDLVVAGHSLGGAVALQFALDFPGEAKALVLVGSGARLRVHPKTLSDLEAQVESGASFDPMQGYDLIAPEVAEVLARRRVENGLAARLNDLRACDAFDVIERLGEINIPVLAICGTEDVMTPPKYTEFLEARLANATSLVLPGGTHQVHVEQPEPVNEAIGAFLQGLG